MKKVLLVEDQPEVRAVLTDVLQFLDCQVEGFSQFNQTLERLENMGSPPELLICDVFLGEQLGTDLASRFRTRFPFLPILYISGFPQSSIPMQIGGKGEYFLQKPFSIKVLKDLLEKAFEKIPEHQASKKS